MPNDDFGRTSPFKTHAVRFSIRRTAGPAGRAIRRAGRVPQWLAGGGG